MPLRRKSRPLGTKPSPKRLSRPEQRVYEAFLDLVRQWKYAYKGNTITELLDDIESTLGVTPLNRFQVLVNEIGTEVAARAGKQSAADFDDWLNSNFRGLNMRYEAHFDSYDPRIVMEIRNHTAMQVIGITNQTRDAIMKAVEDSYTQGFTAQELARNVKPMIGLTHRDATAVTNLYNARIKAGDPPSVARRLADEAAERHLVRRAKTIARTELITAANIGRSVAWSDAIGSGLIDPSYVQQKWVTGNDERLCKICGPMNGQVVDIGEDFFSVTNSTYYSYPPVHPNCRCAVALVERSTSGSSPSVSKHLPGEHNQMNHGRRGYSVRKGTKLYHSAYDHRIETHQANGVMYASKTGESGPGVYLTDDLDQAARRRGFNPGKIHTLVLTTNRDLNLFDRDSHTEAEFRAAKDKGFPGFDGVVWNGLRGVEREIVIHNTADLTITNEVIKHLPGQHDQMKHGRRHGATHTGGVHAFDNYADTFLDDDERGLEIGEPSASDEELQAFIEEHHPNAYSIQSLYDSDDIELGHDFDLAEEFGVKNVTIYSYGSPRLGEKMIEDRYQEQAIYAYTGTYYDTINTNLREGRTNTRYVKELDDYLNDDGHFGLEVFRGTTAAEFGVELDDLPSLTGGIFKSPSYLSTTIDASVAQRFASSGARLGDGHVVMSISVPQKIKARGMATGFGDNPQDEYEVLLQRDQSFRINQVNRLWANVDGEPKVIATLIQAEGI